jgi:hypothetical protein
MYIQGLTVAVRFESFHAPVAGHTGGEQAGGAATRAVGARSIAEVGLWNATRGFTKSTEEKCACEREREREKELGPCQWKTERPKREEAARTRHGVRQGPRPEKVMKRRSLHERRKEPYRNQLTLSIARSNKPKRYFITK